MDNIHWTQDMVRRKQNTTQKTKMTSNMDQQQQQQQQHNKKNKQTNKNGGDNEACGRVSHALQLSERSQLI